MKETQASPQDSLPPCRTVSDQSRDSQRAHDRSEEASDHQPVQSESSWAVSEQQLAQDTPRKAPPQININQPIRSLCGAARSGGPLTVRGEIEAVADEEILKNRESEDEIRSIPRFRNYHPGTPSKVSTAASARHKVFVPA